MWCGYPLNSDAPPYIPPPPPQAIPYGQNPQAYALPGYWELCEIAWEWGPKRGMFTATVKFVGQANGPRGSYPVDKSLPVAYKPQNLGGGTIIPQQTPEAWESLAALAQTLASQGWEEYGIGQFWFSRQFRRRFT